MAEVGDADATVMNPMGLQHDDEGQDEGLLAKEFTTQQVKALQNYLSAAKPKLAAETEGQDKLEAGGAEPQPPPSFGGADAPRCHWGLEVRRSSPRQSLRSFVSAGTAKI